MEFLICVDWDNSTKTMKRFTRKNHKFYIWLIENCSPIPFLFSKVDGLYILWSLLFKTTLKDQVKEETFLREEKIKATERERKGPKEKKSPLSQNVQKRIVVKKKIIDLKI